jgi:hypothetical protein
MSTSHPQTGRSFPLGERTYERPIRKTRVRPEFVQTFAILFRANYKSRLWVIYNNRKELGRSTRRATQAIFPLSIYSTQLCVVSTRPTTYYILSHFFLNMEGTLVVSGLLAATKHIYWVYIFLKQKKTYI